MEIVGSPRDRDEYKYRAITKCEYIEVTQLMIK